MYTKITTSEIKINKNFAYIFKKTKQNFFLRTERILNIYKNAS